ncbi:MAG TPA: Zn-dependent hydrolase [Terriglobales bacterium]|nr:Zn-dependent hydrolase [Terriglobales bacterium]
MTGSAAKGAVSAGMHVAPGLDQRLSKWREVRIPFLSAGLKPQEVRMVEELVDACRYLDEIYWRQSDPQGLSLYQTLQASTNPGDIKVRRLLRINGSRFDLLDENKPFVGTEPMPPGHALYPQGLTREQIEQYVKLHPEKKAEIYSPTTVVRWHGDQLEGLPYHIAYRSFLEPAARDLREAAQLSADPAFAEFLRLRADALLSDDYFKSDLAWVDLKDPKFDLIFAPYETYLDDLLGVKGSYGAAVLIRNPGESEKLAIFQKYVPDIQDALPLPPEDRPSKKGQVTPLEVMDATLRAGDLLHGYQAVADNLPNDPRIHEQKGTKKIFFKNFMDARVNYIILPVAGRIMRKDQAAKVSREGYLLATILHEISHGLGPAFARGANGKVDIRQAIGPTYSGLEEAKADVVGMFGLKWLVDHGVLPKDQLEDYYASYVAGLFRTVRFGIGEAHSRAEMMEFNYLSECGAIKREPTGRYTIDYAAMPGIINDLAKKLLEIEATGDRARAEKWFAKYDIMPEELKISLKLAADLPVDIDPVFSFKETMR